MAVNVVGYRRLLGEDKVAMSKRSTEVPEDQEIVYRVYIGGIIADENDIHGNPVNLAGWLRRCFAWGPQVIKSTAFASNQSAAGYREFHCLR